MTRALSLLAALALVACGGQEPEPTQPPGGATGPPRVATTFAPTAYLASRLAGPAAEVFCDLPEDADALFWEPDDVALRRVQEADLVVLFGAGMDVWRERVSLPSSRVVVAAERFRAQWIEFDESVAHSHGGGERHVHTGTDPHAWIDPLLLLEAGRAVHEALVRVLGPDARAGLDARLGSLEADLRALHDGFAALEIPEGEWLYASHPAYDYLARRHGWSVVNLDLSPGEAPAQDVVQTVALQLERRPGRLILWEAEPGEAARAAFAKLGLESVVFSPAEVVADGDDVLAVQRANLARLAAALGAGR